MPIKLCILYSNTVEIYNLEPIMKQREVGQSLLFFHTKLDLFHFFNKAVQKRIWL